MIEATGLTKRYGDTTAVDGLVWRTNHELLKYNTGYTVRARAVDVDGLAARQSVRFRTVDPKTMVYSSITPFSRQVVGVGMPIIVSFDAPVPNRAAAERRLSVNTSPQTVGSWYWVSDQMVRWAGRRSTGVRTQTLSSSPNWPE